MCALRCARVVDETQQFLDAITGGAKIEYDEQDEAVGGLLSLLIMMTIECPHCGKDVVVEYDPQEPKDEV